MASSVTRGALVIVAVVVVAHALAWMSAILTPLALALFLTIMIDGFARVLDRRVKLLPPWASLPVAIGVTFVVTIVMAYTVADHAGTFAGALLAAAPRLNELIAHVGAALGVKVPPTVQSLVNQLNPTSYIGNLARWLQSFTAGAAAVLIYLGFLIASRQGLSRKVGFLFPDAHEREHAVKVFERIRFGVERYLWLQTVTGLMIAGASWIAMALVHLQNAPFWAFLIFVACYIPVIGGFIGSVLPPLFALLQFQTYWQAAALFAALQVVMFVVGSVVLPRMQRDSLNIDPVVVLLALAFWGALWGVAGMFLSTPLTVMAIIILAQFPGSRWIAILLSGDGEPEREAGGAPEPTPAKTASAPPPALPGPLPSSVTQA